MSRCALLILFMALALSPGIADASSYAGLNMYGYPMSIGPGGGSGLGVPGEGYTYHNDGLGLPDSLTSRYGMISTSVQSGTGAGNTGYCGPSLNGIYLGVSYGFPQQLHDAATTSYARDLAYEASLDNAFIAFPGIGTGSLGVSSPAICSNKADVKYAESVKFQLSTESDSLSLGGFSYPLGLGLGYSSYGVNGAIGLTDGGLGLPFYYA